MKTMKFILRTIVTLVFLAFWGSAKAIDITFVEGKNEFNAPYQAVNGTYAVKADGKVLVEAMEEFAVSCNGTTFTSKYVPASSHGAFHYEVDAKGGQTISISTEFLWNSPAVIWITEQGEGPVALKIENASPAIGGKFTWERAGQLTINFNKPVTAKSIKFIANGKNYDVDDVNLGTNVSVNVKNAIERATEDGNLKEGVRFLVRFEGLCDADDASNLYAGTGILTADYVAPAVQGTMVSAKADGQDINATQYTFLSYYDPDGENGVITFEFSRKVKNVTSAVLSMGNIDLSDAGLYYREELAPVIEDNKVIIDLRGKLRSLARLFPTYDVESGTELDVSHISLQLFNVVDESGNPFASEGLGTIGSYAYTFNYKEIKDDIVMDGDNCQENDDVTDGQNIRLWIDRELKQIDKLLVTYYVLDESIEPDPEEGTEYYSIKAVEVTTDKIAVLPDPDGCIVSFNLPDMPGAAKDQRVIVTLSVKTMNGMPHDLSIKFWYGGVHTGINNITTEKTKTSDIYDLAGRKTNPRAHGIYIMNGKKYISK